MEYGFFQKKTKALLIKIKYLFMGPCKLPNLTKTGYAFGDVKTQDIYRYLKENITIFSDITNAVNWSNYKHKG